jgi:hypothetical protein
MDTSARMAQVLLDVAGLAHLWPGEPYRLADIDTHDLSRGQVIMVRTARDLWNQTAGVTIHELLLLDRRNLEAVGSALVAIAQGEDARRAWIAQWEAR